MEGLTRLVSESLARYGFDRPLDYRRLHWSRWFRCESHHSLLLVPSKPGVFALAEETIHIATDAFVRPADAERGRIPASANQVNTAHTFAAAPGDSESDRALPTRRMLAVSQFFDDDDMAYVLDRMLSSRNPMSVHLASGRYFVRFVVIEDVAQRRSICNALNQWIASSADKASGIGAHFASSLELTSATEFIPAPDPNQGNLFGENPGANQNAATPIVATQNATTNHVAVHAEQAFLSAPVAVTPISRENGSTSASPAPLAAPQLDSGAAVNRHCPLPLPSGF